MRGPPVGFLHHETARILASAAVSVAWYGFWSVTMCCLTTLGVTLIRSWRD
jgi:hypothetical protein